MGNTILQYVLYVVILVALAIPLGGYIGKIMNGEKVWLSKILSPVEGLVYKALRVNKEEQMGWKKYAASVGLFSIFSFIALFLILMLQGHLPWNPEGISGMSPDLAFNTAVSFVTNTNWQAYSGETGLSELRVCGSRNLCTVCLNPWIYKSKVGGAWKLLGRSYESGPVCSCSIVNRSNCSACVSGCCAKYEQL